MADGVTIEVDPASLAALQAQIRRMEEATGRETRTVVRNTARDVAFAGQRFTPLARRYENEAAPVPTGRKRGKNRYAWAWIERRHDGGMARLPVELRQAWKHGQVWRARGWRLLGEAGWSGSRRRVYNLGYHKGGWSGVLSALGVRRRTRSQANPARWLKDSSDKTGQAFEIVGTGQYTIEEALSASGFGAQNRRHRIADRAIAFVVARMQRSLDKMAGVIRATR